MKILFFNYEYPPLGGGAGNASHYLLKEFSRRENITVDFVTSSVTDQYEQERLGDHIVIHRLPIGKNRENLHYQSQKDLLMYSWKAYRFSKDLIRKNHYDLSHAFFTIPCGFLSYRLKQLSKMPYIVSLRGADVPGYSERFSLLYTFTMPIVRSIWANASYVIANSEGLKELALKTKPDQAIGVIYNGVNTEMFVPDESKRKSNIIRLTTGASRVTGRKGIRYLIDAIKLLSKNYPNLYMDVMGDGDVRVDLEQYTKELGLSDRIVFIGRVPNDETYVHYQKADIFVLPSLNEGMSNAMLEALATGLPIIATDTGGTKELLKEGQNGLMIKMRSAEDIAEKLERLISDTSLRLKMGSESRKIAESMSWHSVSQQYYSLYEKVASKGVGLRTI